MEHNKNNNPTSDLQNERNDWITRESDWITRESFSSRQSLSICLINFLNTCGDVYGESQKLHQFLLKTVDCW